MRFNAYTRGKPKRPYRPGRSWFIRQTPWLEEDEWDIIEQVRATGQLSHYSANDFAMSPQRYLTSKDTGSMREAELRSRDADRYDSVWFNNEMLLWWAAKWHDDDLANLARDEVMLAAKQQRRLQRQLRLKDRAEEFEAWKQEEKLWMRQQGWLEQERKKRIARWSAEEREWYQWEQQCKADKLKAASGEFEARNSLRRRQFRQILSTKRTIRELASHVNRRYPRHRRHQRENVGDLETT